MSCDPSRHVGDLEHPVVSSGHLWSLSPTAGSWTRETEERGGKWGQNYDLNASPHHITHVLINWETRPNQGSRKTCTPSSVLLGKMTPDDLQTIDTSPSPHDTCSWLSPHPTTTLQTIHCHNIIFIIHEEESWPRDTEQTICTMQTTVHTHYKRTMNVC